MRLSDAELVEGAVQVRGVAIDPERAGRRELVPAVAARQQADAQHSGAARREQIPDRVADDIAVANVHAKLLLALEKEIGLGLRSKDIAAVDDHRLRRNAQRRERAVDLRMPPGCGDAVGDLLLAQPAQELDRAWEWPAFRKELAKELAVACLDPAGVIVIERLSD